MNSNAWRSQQVHDFPFNDYELIPWSEKSTKRFLQKRFDEKNQIEIVAGREQTFLFEWKNQKQIRKIRRFTTKVILLISLTADAIHQERKWRSRILTIHRFAFWMEFGFFFRLAVFQYNQLKNIRETKSIEFHELMVIFWECNEYFWSIILNFVSWWLNRNIETNRYFRLMFSK